MTVDLSSLPHPALVVFGLPVLLATAALLVRQVWERRLREREHRRFGLPIIRFDPTGGTTTYYKNGEPWEPSP